MHTDATLFEMRVYLRALEGELNGTADPERRERFINEADRVKQMIDKVKAGLVVSDQ